MRVTASRWASALSIVVLISGTASSQVTTGVPSFGSFSGGPFDIVNNGSLNVHFEIAVLTKGGRGAPFQYTLSYDSTVYSPVSINGVLHWEPAPNYGWRDVTEASYGYISYALTTPACSPGPGTELDYSSWTYHDSHGVQHSFPTVLKDKSGCPGGTGQSGTWVATDNSVLTLSANTANLHGTSAGFASIITKSGVNLGVPTVATSAGNSGTPCATASAICDANGNYSGASVTVQGSTITTTFTDTLGTTPLTVAVTSPQSTSTPNTYTYTGPSGPVAVKVNYGQFSVLTNFGCGHPLEYLQGAQLITSIDLPDGTSYSFTYEPTPGDSNDVTGRLASVKLPTGATIQYTYTGGSNGIECADGSAAGVTRTVSGPGITTGTWTYTRSGTVPTSTITTVVDPASNQTVMDFSGDSAGDYDETQRTVNQGSSSTLEAVSTYYNSTSDACSAGTLSLRITRKTVCTTLYGQNGSPNVTKSTSSTYNSNGLPAQTDDYGFASNFLRKTVIQYAALGNYIADRPSEVQVYNEQSGQVLNSQTTYAYDEYSLQSTQQLSPQHYGVSGSRGNATTIKHYTSSSAYVTRNYHYFDTGNVYQAIDINNATTTYKYPDATSTCGNAFTTETDLPLSLTTYGTWNCNGAVEASATDVNSQVTQFSYTDPNFWRLTSTTDPAGAITTLSYCTASCPNAFTTESTLTFNSNASTYDILTTFDALGRPHVSQRRNGPGASTYDTVETDYGYVTGLVTRVTMPYTAGAGATKPTAPATTTTYDAMSRPLSITDGGGGQVSYAYNQRDVLKTVSPAPNGENTKKWQYEYDALGDLLDVCEMTTMGGSGTCNQTASQTGWWTTYSYDALGDLSAPSGSPAVSQNAQGSSPQNRYYNYDLLGRLTSETNPESGATSYTYDHDGSGACSGTYYNGDLVKKVDAVGTVSCYTYDALHRVSSMTYNDGTTHPRYFVYDSATVDGAAMPNAKGRLAEAYTGSANSKVTDLGFGYSTRGESTDTYTWNVDSGAGGWYHVNEAYRLEYGLPFTLDFYSNSGAQLIPAIAYGADSEGRVNSVSASSGQNPVTSVTYGCATLISAVTYGNGEDAFTCDPNTGRMTQYNLNVGGQSVLGNLTWNANGTLQKLAITDPFNSTDSQTCNYGYDDVARLASANCGSLFNQTFAPGALANLSQSGTLTFQPSYNAATNQITSVGGQNYRYDADGNLQSTGTGVGTNTYTWNAYDGMAGDTPYGSNQIVITHDGLGRITLEQNGSTYTSFVYAPSGEKLAVMNGQTLNKARIGLPGGGLAIYDPTGLIRYWRTDWQGSVRLTSNPDGTYYGSGAYAPYGQTYAQSPGGPDSPFAGLITDTSGELDDALFREYNPTQGRWMSPDPAGLAAVDLTNPQSLNRYAYVGNNPVNATDRTGLIRTTNDPCNNPFFAEGDASCAGPGSNGWGWGGAGGGWGGGGGGGAGGGAWGPLPTPLDGTQAQANGTEAENRYLSIISTGWDPVLQVQYNSWVAYQNGKEIQNPATVAASAFGEQACAGQDTTAVASCIQQVYNQLPQLDMGMTGGHEDYQYANPDGNLLIQINGALVDPADFGCFLSRCGQMDSLDYSHYSLNAGYTFHVDTANPLFFPIGTAIHVGADLIGGNTWWSGGVPLW